MSYFKLLTPGENINGATLPVSCLEQGGTAQWAKLANLGSVLISVRNIFIKSQKYFGSFIIYFLKNILVK